MAPKGTFLLSARI